MISFKNFKQKCLVEAADSSAERENAITKKDWNAFDKAFKEVKEYSHPIHGNHFNDIIQNGEVFDELPKPLSLAIILFLSAGKYSEDIIFKALELDYNINNTDYRKTFLHATYVLSELADKFKEALQEIPKPKQGGIPVKKIFKDRHT